MRRALTLPLGAFVLGCAVSPGPAPAESFAGGSASATANEGSSRVAVAAAPPAPKAPSSADVRAVVKAPFERGQVWIGTYTCAQGLTDLVLSIRGVEDDVVDAVFAFEHRPSGARGSYAMHGEYSPAKLELTLQPGAWIEHPPAYVTVGLDGYVAGSEFWGTITDSSCSTFSLSLSTSAPPAHRAPATTGHPFEPK